MKNMIIFFQFQRFVTTFDNRTYLCVLMSQQTTPFLKSPTRKRSCCVGWYFTEVTNSVCSNSWEWKIDCDCMSKTHVKKLYRINQRDEKRNRKRGREREREHTRITLVVSISTSLMNLSNPAVRSWVLSWFHWTSLTAPS